MGSAERRGASCVIHPRLRQGNSSGCGKAVSQGQWQACGAGARDRRRTFPAGRRIPAIRREDAVSPGLHDSPLGACPDMDRRRGMQGRQACQLRPEHSSYACRGTVFRTGGPPDASATGVRGSMDTACAFAALADQWRVFAVTRRIRHFAAAPCRRRRRWRSSRRWMRALLAASTAIIAGGRTARTQTGWGNCHDAAIRPSGETERGGAGSPPYPSRKKKEVGLRWESDPSIPANHDGRRSSGRTTSPTIGPMPVATQSNL